MHHEPCSISEQMTLMHRFCLSGKGLSQMDHQAGSPSFAKCRDVEFESDSLNESLLRSHLTPPLNNESVFGCVPFKMNGEYL